MGLGFIGLSVHWLLWVACADKPINGQSLEIGLTDKPMNGQSLEMGPRFFGLSVGLGSTDKRAESGSGL